MRVGLYTIEILDPMDLWEFFDDDPREIEGCLSKIK